jgi:hypothetical protein
MNRSLEVIQLSRLARQPTCLVSLQRGFRGSFPPLLNQAISNYSTGTSTPARSVLCFHRARSKKHAWWHKRSKTTSAILRSGDGSRPDTISCFANFRPQITSSQRFTGMAVSPDPRLRGGSTALLLTCIGLHTVARIASVRRTGHLAREGTHPRALALVASQISDKKDQFDGHKDAPSH